MANMVLDMDLEHPALDENISDWVKVFSTSKSCIVGAHPLPPPPSLPRGALPIVPIREGSARKEYLSLASGILEDSLVEGKGIL